MTRHIAPTTSACQSWNRLTESPEEATGVLKLLSDGCVPMALHGGCAIGTECLVDFGNCLTFDFKKEASILTEWPGRLRSLEWGSWPPGPAFRTHNRKAVLKDRCY